MTKFYQDEDENEAVAPLLLDDAGEGQLPRSKAPFFTIPSELLRVIVQDLDSSSLSSFALANWDCLQLARTRRLANVLFNDSYSSISIIKKLRAEGEERVRSPTGHTSRPSIGACIRRITVDTRWLSRQRRLHPEDDIGQRRTSHNFLDSYVPALIRIFKMCPQILPHLDFLDWKDNIAIRELLCPDFSCLPIKHLRLYRVTNQEVQFIDKLRRFFSGYPDPINTRGSTSSCASILRLCSRTLLSLTWEDLAFKRMSYSLTISDSEAVQFPCLRELRLGDIEFSDSASLATLLGTNLVTLYANTEATAIHKQCFKNRGTILSLKTFVWETLHISVDNPLDFLRANQQLSKFRIPYPVSSVVLETRLLPLLSSSFTNLCSLSLVWAGTKIPASALKIISTIKSLQQIHLSVWDPRGDQYRPEFLWEIDHQLMRICLSSLPHLRKLAFSHDSYDDGSDVVSFYAVHAAKALAMASVVQLEGEDLDSIEHHAAIWKRLNKEREQLQKEEEKFRKEREQLHKERMLKEAGEYIGVLPKLEWLYIGQIPMSVVESPTQRGSRSPIPLCPHRADLWTTLEKIFG